jgi:hypothetical protein
MGSTLIVQTEKFSGEGEAWFNLTEIASFADQLESFAKTTKKPPTIKGGNWSGKGELVETSLSFRLY